MNKILIIAALAGGLYLYSKRAKGATTSDTSSGGSDPVLDPIKASQGRGTASLPTPMPKTVLQNKASITLAKPVTGFLPSVW